MVKIIRDDHTTSFWDEVWIGDVLIRVRFPRLFQVFSLHVEMVRVMGSCVDGVWV